MVTSSEVAIRAKNRNLEMGVPVKPDASISARLYMVLSAQSSFQRPDVGVSMERNSLELLRSSPFIPEKPFHVFQPLRRCLPIVAGFFLSPSLKHEKLRV